MGLYRLVRHETGHEQGHGQGDLDAPSDPESGRMLSSRARLAASVAE
jgi:hypothetical protein